MKGINLYSVIRNSTVCYLWLEGEPVIGTFFTDGTGMFTGIHFRSSICRFCAEVTDVKMRKRDDCDNDLLISFDEGNTLHLVCVLTVEDCLIHDTGSILP